MNETWPGAYYEPDVTYACVTGRAVIGNASAEPKTVGKYAAGSYAVVAVATATASRATRSCPIRRRWRSKVRR